VDFSLVLRRLIETAPVFVRGQGLLAPFDVVPRGPAHGIFLNEDDRQVRAEIALLSPLEARRRLSSGARSQLTLRNDRHDAVAIPTTSTKKNHGADGPHTIRLDEPRTRTVQAFSQNAAHAGVLRASETLQQMHRGDGVPRAAVRD